MFICRQSWQFSFKDNTMIILFPICTLNWRVNNYVSRHGKGRNRRNESTVNILYKFAAFYFCTTFDMINCFCLVETFSLIKEKINFFVTNKFFFNLHNRQSFSLRIKAVLRKKRKLAAVSRETPQNTRNHHHKTYLTRG